MNHREHKLRRSAGISAIVALTALLTGCGGGHELKVVLPDDSAVAEDAIVYVEGVGAGRINDVSLENSRRIATVVIEDSDLAYSKIRYGIVVRERDDGGLDVDASAVNDDALPLPRGSVIEVTRETMLQAAFRRYATWKTIAATAVGALAILALIWFFKMISQIGIVITSLILALGASWATHTWITGLVEWAMTAGADADVPLRELATLPNPRWVAFFIAWIFWFIVIQMLIGMGLRATRKPATA